MPDLTAREKKVLSKHTKSIINQLLKEPITQAKELAGSGNSEALQLFVDIFGIEEEVRDEFAKQAKKDETLMVMLKKEQSPFKNTEEMTTV